jgi:hypothetical protein
MTAQERIDHVAEARRLLSAEANGGTQAERALLLQGAMQAAQVHATLALVEQQRIANLIALASGEGSSWDEALPILRDEAAAALMEFERTPATPFSGPDDYPVVRVEIRKALGL